MAWADVSKKLTPPSNLDVDEMRAALPDEAEATGMLTFQFWDMGPRALVVEKMSLAGTSWSSNHDPFASTIKSMTHYFQVCVAL
jgi:hypothetical protein